MENKTGLDDELYKLLVEKKKDWIINMLDKINGIQNLVSFYDKIDDKEYFKPFGKEMVSWHTKKNPRITFNCLNCKKLGSKLHVIMLKKPYCEICTETLRLKKKKKTYSETLKKDNNNINKILEKIYLKEIININDVPIENVNYDTIWIKDKLLLKCFHCNINTRLIRVDRLLNFPYYGCHKCAKLKDRKIQSVFPEEKKIILNHNVTLKYKCDIINCNKSYDSEHKLACHKFHKHGISAVKNYLKCNICTNNNKLYSRVSLKHHQAHVHGINTKLFKCLECEKNNIITTFKCKSNLTKHLSSLHDIGSNECQFCIKNKNSSIEYENKYGKFKICRVCYKKETGRSSRIEHEASDYIDKHFGSDYLNGNDKTLKSLGGCELLRPDKLYIDINYVLLIEIDEKQHRNKSNYSCEESRISKIYDEPGINGKNMIVIRWNPDPYKVPENYTKFNKNERLELIVKLMRLVTKHDFDDKIHIFYMFYNKDNDQIVKNIPYTLIYDETDFPKYEL